MFKNLCIRLFLFSFVLSHIVPAQCMDGGKRRAPESQREQPAAKSARKTKTVEDLRQAIQNQNVTDLQACVADGVDINKNVMFAVHGGHNNGPALLHAAFHNNPNIAFIRALLGISSIDVNKSGTIHSQIEHDKDVSPLWAAVDKGHAAVVRELARANNVDLCARGSMGGTHLGTPLMRAIEKNRVECVRELVAVAQEQQKDIGINLRCAGMHRQESRHNFPNGLFYTIIREQFRNFTPLVYAVLLKRADCLAELVKIQNIDIHQQKYDLSSVGKVFFLGGILQPFAPTREDANGVSLLSLIFSTNDYKDLVPLLLTHPNLGRHLLLCSKVDSEALERTVQQEEDVLAVLDNACFAGRCDVVGQLLSKLVNFAQHHQDLSDATADGVTVFQSTRRIRKINQIHGQVDCVYPFCKKENSLIPVGANAHVVEFDGKSYIYHETCYNDLLQKLGYVQKMVGALLSQPVQLDARVTCPICVDGLTEKSLFVRTPCQPVNHLLCCACFGKWVMEKATCPECRQSFGGGNGRLTVHRVLENWDPCAQGCF